jgi:hypothetical protein
MRTALTKVHLGPVLEPGRLCGGRSFEAGGLPSNPALNLLFTDGGVAPHGLVCRPEVSATQEPEVVVPDVAPFPEAHSGSSTRADLAQCQSGVPDAASLYDILRAGRMPHGLNGL